MGAVTGTITETPADPVGSPRRRRGLSRLPEARWAAAALVLFLAGLAVQVTGGPGWASWPLYLACYAAGGWEPGLAGLRALREKTLDVDLLMVAAAIGAAAIGQVLDGGLLIVIFATSGALEALATARTEDSVRGLLDLAPDTATRVRAGAEARVLVGGLAVGDVIRVRPGERVGADGRVADGASEVDQATITGEPLPVDKAAGDEVFAGTLNGTGTLLVRVARPAGESVVARIAELVAEASRTKARTQLFVERIEQRYAVGMVAATLVLFTVPLLLGRPLQESLLRAMTFMIVASPCAVVLSTMPPLLAAIANAGRHGVLVKSAVVMEQLGATDQVAFDKTGTLTRGTPHLAGIRPLPTAGLAEHEILRLAAGAENPSEHHLARAIVDAARHRGIAVPGATGFTAEPGRGVTARIDGHDVQIGSPAALLTGPGTPEAQAAAGALAADGHTAVAVLIDGRPAALLGITDQTRPEAAPAIAALTAITGRAPALLTGDNPQAAGRLARTLAITDVHAGLLPEDKVAAIRHLQADQNGSVRTSRKITMVGDGINDAPALAAADTGIAMGGAGTALTLHAADAVIIRDDLTTIPAVIALARRARRLVTANLAIAAAFVTVLVAWDLAGHLPLPLGVAGHEGSTVLVGLNGLRLLRGPARTPAMAPRPMRRG
ncbi:MAG TPA: heavy metal translocating P-type ATPase [Streptosporangiaceae bacterium]|jgi:heavy metal translocating P-type ATPase